VRIQTAVKMRSRRRTCDDDERGGKNSSSERASLRVTVNVDANPWCPAKWCIVTGSKPLASH
jgi:hypothetical protein